MSKLWALVEMTELEKIGDRYWTKQSSKPCAYIWTTIIGGDVWTIGGDVWIISGDVWIIVRYVLLIGGVVLIIGEDVLIISGDVWILWIIGGDVTTKISEDNILLSELQE